MADRALKNYERFTQKKVKPKIPFEDLLNLLLSHQINPETEEIELPLERDHRIYKSIIIYDISEDALIYRRRTKNDIVKDEAKKLLISKLTARYLGQDIKEAINEKYYEAVINAVSHYEEGIREEEDANELRNYVLIIDEINRANISLVFGELITLIEPDKRHGAAQALSVSLPSGELLSVPTNLYILATMNTADKSIAQLDIALRRRFVFQGLYPDESLIENSSLREILKKLNQALYAEKRSADFLIGHAFFMNKTEADLALVFDGHILPLLEEYFPNRPDKIRQVLQAAGIQLKEENLSVKISSKSVD
ncbi:MAG: AAA domain-containing protein, partial [Bacteroidia bacterium]|nr:AAA domain-containing protein [Bacteroidia bacterium]